jgi:hypothetical protein
VGRGCEALAEGSRVTEDSALTELLLLASERGRRELTFTELVSLRRAETWLKTNTDGMREPGA